MLVTPQFIVINIHGQWQYQPSTINKTRIVYNIEMLIPNSNGTSSYISPVLMTTNIVSILMQITSSIFIYCMQHGRIIWMQMDKDQIFKLCTQQAYFTATQACDKHVFTAHCLTGQEFCIVFLHWLTLWLWQLDLDNNSDRESVKDK